MIRGFDILGGTKLGVSHLGIFEYYLSSNLRIYNQTLNIDILNSNGLNVVFPIAKAELYYPTSGTILALPNVKSFSVSRNRDHVSDTFSLEIADAITYNSRVAGTWLDVLNTKINKWVRIYGGYKVGGTNVYYPIFVGIVQEITENYGVTESSISMSGMNLAKRLQQESGDYSAYGATYAQTLLIKILNDCNVIVSSIFAFSNFVIAAGEINEVSAAGAIDYIVKKNGTLEWFFDASGRFVVRTRNTSPSANFTYNLDHPFTPCNTMKKYESSRELINSVQIDGDGVTAIIEDSTFKTNYGRQFASYTNTLIKTVADLTTAGENYINESKRYLNRVDLNVLGNPVLEIGDGIQVTKTDAGISDIYYITQFSHNYNEESANFQTYLTGWKYS